MNNLKFAALLSLILIAVALCIQPRAAIFEYSPQSKITTESTKVEYRIAMTVSDLGDGYFRIIPDDCLTRLAVNGMAFEELPVPYCDTTVGRPLNLGKALKVGSNLIEADVFNTFSTGGVAIESIPNPWKAIAREMLYILAVLIAACSLIQKLIPEFVIGEGYKVYARFIQAVVVVSAAVFTVVSLRKIDIELGQVFLVMAAWGILVVWLVLLKPMPLRKLSFEDVPVRWLSHLVLLAAVGAYCGYVGYTTVFRHSELKTAAFDLAIQENLIWNTLHGNFFISSVMGNILYLGNHTSLIYLILLPIYALFPHAETLLIAQAILVGGAAVPLYLWASLRFRSYEIGALLSVAYLLHPLIEGANFYDFHELSFVPILFFSAILMHSLRRTFWMWLSIFLLLLVKEDAGIVLGTCGAGLLIAGNMRIGLQFVAAGVSAYMIFQGNMIPTFAGGDRSYVHYFEETFPNISSPSQLIEVIVSDPFGNIFNVFSYERLLYLLQAYGPLLCIPLFSLGGVVAGSYGIFLALFGGTFALYTQGFQYAFNLVPAVFLFGVLALSNHHSRERKQRQKTKALIACVVLASAALFSLYGMVAPLHTFKGGFSTIERGESFFNRSYNALETKEILDLIPPDAAVLATESATPHLARRRQIQVVNRVNGGLFGNFDYVLVAHGSKEHSAKENFLKHKLKVELVESNRFVALYRIQRNG